MKGLDTTFLVDLLKRNAAATSKAVELENELLFTTEANVYEIVSGIHTGKDAERALRELHSLLSRLVVFPLDRRASLQAGAIAAALRNRGQMIDDVDCLTAGILMVNGCDTILTRNTRHFSRIPGLKAETY